MRPLLPIMSQWINHSRTFNKFEHVLIRYGQLIIYFLALAIIGVFYMGAQKTIANYLESLQVIQLPQF
jgi:hypothetical protein